jgi:L-arabinose transport system substrate-binding protein
MKQMKERGWKPEETGLCAVTFDENETIKERTDGAIDAATEAGFPKDRVFKAPQTKLDVEASLNSVNALLTKQPGVKRWLICGGNDSAVMGAIRATEGQGLTPKEVCGIGINGTDCLVEFERESPTGFYASVLLAPKAHGYGTAEMVYKWVKDGVEPPMDTRTVGTMINRENYKQVLKEQGIQD